jgi:hypothetical protein
MGAGEIVLVAVIFVVLAVAVVLAPLLAFRAGRAIATKREQRDA